jgi:hypothetical protein
MSNLQLWWQGRSAVRRQVSPKATLELHQFREDMEEIRLPIGEGENQPAKQIHWRTRQTGADMLLEEAAIVEPDHGSSSDLPPSSSTDRFVRAMSQDSLRSPSGLTYSKAGDRWQGRINWIAVHWNQFIVLLG